MNKYLTQEENDLVVEAKKYGTIDIEAIAAEISMIKRKEILSKHPHKIWFGNGKWQTYLPDGNSKRVRRKRNTQSEIEDVIIEYWEQAEAKAPTFEDIFNEWNQSQWELGQIKRSTFNRNEQVYKRHYTEFGQIPIDRIRPYELEDFLKGQIAKHKLTAKGFSNLKTITRGTLKRAYKRDLISFSVTEFFDNLEISKRSFYHKIKEETDEVYTEEEESAMVIYLTQHPDIWNLGILLLFVTGMRIGELVALKWSCVADGVIKIRRGESKINNENGEYEYIIVEHPKTEAGARDIVIPDDCHCILDALYQITGTEEYIFTRDGERMTTNTIRSRLARNCIKLGMKVKSPHKIRKTYASILLDNGIDKRFILDQMGHTEIECTERHYHRTRRDSTKKAAMLGGLFGGYYSHLENMMQSTDWIDGCDPYCDHSSNDDLENRINSTFLKADDGNRTRLLSLGS